MQAKESLNFAEPFGPNREYEATSPEITLTQGYFIRACLDLLDRYPDNIKRHDVLEASGLMTAFESSLTLQFSDASYLHVLVFGHSDESGYVDLCIAAEEHDDKNMPSVGYVYTLNGDGLLRTTTRNQDNEFEEGDDTHFSLIGLYEGLSELRELELSDDEEVTRYAREALEKIEQDVSMGVWECELGYDGQKPTLSEIEQLASIIGLASPRVREV